MVENVTKEYNLTDTSTNKKMKAVVAHEYSKKTNVVGKKFTKKHGGWKIQEDKEEFSISDPQVVRLSDMRRN